MDSSLLLHLPDLGDLGYDQANLSKSVNLFQFPRLIYWHRGQGLNGYELPPSDLSKYMLVGLHTAAVPDKYLL